jgi:hypothetical protein
MRDMRSYIGQTECSRVTGDKTVVFVGDKQRCQRQGRGGHHHHLSLSSLLVLRGVS